MSSRNMPLCLVVWLVVCAAGLPPSAFSAEKAKKDCFDKAQTQAELNACAGEEFAAADAELNRVYKAVQEKYKADSGFLEKLRAAQRAWLAYRDAEFEAKFPPGERSGSIFPMCAAQYKTELTRERIAKLRVWLDGAEEGDVCAGSVLPIRAAR